MFFEGKWRYLEIYKKYSFLRTLWFLKNENFAAHEPRARVTKVADFLELASLKYTWSAAMCPLSKKKKNSKSFHTTVLAKLQVWSKPQKTLRISALSTGLIQYMYNKESILKNCKVRWRRAFSVYWPSFTSREMIIFFSSFWENLR